jgi:hypothetical protein
MQIFCVLCRRYRMNQTSSYSVALLVGLYVGEARLIDGSAIRTERS